MVTEYALQRLSHTSPAVLLTETLFWEQLRATTKEVPTRFADFSKTRFPLRGQLVQELELLIVCSAGVLVIVLVRLAVLTEHRRERVVVHVHALLIAETRERLVSHGVDALQSFLGV